MAAAMQGRAVYYDGTVHPYAIGSAECIKAERRYGVSLDKLDRTEKVGMIEYLAYMAFEALRRQGDVTNVGFDTWLEGLEDVGLAEDAEGESPPPRTV